MSGTWAAVGRGWRVFAPAAVVGAGAQAALVIGDPEPLASVGFVLLVIASFVVVVSSVAVISAGALAAIDRDRVRLGTPLILWSVVSVLVAVGAALLAAPLVILAALLALLLLPAAAAGHVNPFPTGFAVFRHGALRTVLALLVAVVLLMLSWALAFALGFFVTGVVASAITWLWFGLTGVVLLVWFTARYRRGTPA